MMLSEITVVAGIIYKDEDHFLIAKRKTGKVNAGFWELPGGKIETGEKAEVALERELKEELDITIDEVRYFTQSIFTDTDLKIILECYTCRFVAGTFTLSDHDEILWIRKEEVADYIFTKADRSVLMLLHNLSL
ncbi:(deoxy)nucleoside triphosphate pyrophosphohydrolase [soil metagenome]